jgi:hypothetical protein
VDPVTDECRLLVSAVVEVESILPVLATDARRLCNASSVILVGLLPADTRKACASAITMESMSETCMLLRNLGRRESILSPSSDSPSEEEDRDSMLVSPKSELARMLCLVRLLRRVETRLLRADTGDIVVAETGGARDMGETGVLGLFNVEGRELI